MPAVPAAPVAPDLVTRAAGFKKVEQPVSEETFDYKDIEKIQDPNAKALVEKAYKSMQRGFTPKLQEAAEMKRKIEELEKRVGDTSNWTPQRIEQALSDPNFVSAAQTFMQTQKPSGASMTEEAWSNLTDAEKAKFQQMEQELSTLKQHNFESARRQQDESLKTKYANYEPVIVDQLMNDLVSGKMQATREHLWRVLDYEDAVQRAYEMGKSDARSGTNDSINSMSFTAGGVNSSPDAALEMGKDGKVNPEFFRKLYSHHLQRSKTQIGR
jgi:hypothetical protein